MAKKGFAFIYLILNLSVSILITTLVQPLVNYNKDAFIFWLATFFTILLAVIINLRNPGYLTFQLANQQIINQQIQNKDDVLTQKQKNSQRLQSSPRNLNIQTNNNNIVQKRLCKLCNFNQPLRTKHCYSCGKCVLTFDHHCPYLKTCIGEKNKAIFYIFLVFQISQLVCGAILLQKQFSIEKKNYATIILFGFILIPLTMIIMLLIFHIFLMIKGITTWQFFSWDTISYLRGIPKLQSPFSNSIGQNIIIYWRFVCRKQRIDWRIKNVY